MIENLNKQLFTAYGRILQENPSGQSSFAGEGKKQEIRSYFYDNVWYYRAVGETYLDFESGMTVLVIRKGEDRIAFYLDKPVCIPKGTEFALLPYQRECSVRMAYPVDAEPEQLEPCQDQGDLKISSRLHLGEIYTLFYRVGESGFFFKGEKHTAYELTYVDRGQLHCVVDGTGYSLKQGQMMIFLPNQWHMQYTDLNTTAHFLTVSFDLRSDLELLFGDRVFDLSSMEATYLKQLLQEPEIMDAYSNDVIRSNLKLLLLSILRDTHKRRKRLKTPTALRNENTIVGRTLQYIADHVYDRLSVEIVAKETGVSASHLTALFRRQMSISPGEYIRRVKLEESKSLIREGKMNFSQIAATLQYSTIHHFSRQFKENFGISPSEYAKSLKS
ncbi:MAG: AraC family transcriptional regulator [Oscillospiraceae bacterium]|nr:AraC family transcriptional regulator [Oscillospiraceae bacterium]